jgi:hypothetical protein
MSDGDDSFEVNRRELTGMLLDSVRQNQEIGYGLEKVLVSLSAGALLFSMTFISALAPGKRWLVLLFFAWVWFAVSITCVVVGMRKSQWAAGARAEQASEALRQLEKDKAAGRSSTVQVAAARNRRGLWLNNSSVGAFLAGIVCLGIFVGVNLWWGR